MSDQNFSGSIGAETHVRIGTNGTQVILQAGGTTAAPTLLVSGSTLTGVALSSSLASMATPMTSGKWFNPNSTGGTGTSGANSRCVMVPVLFAAPCVLNGMSIDITIAGDAAGVERFGIYTDVSGVPTALLADLGTVAGDSTGANALTISQAVNAGWYWFAVADQLQVTTRATKRTPTLQPTLNRFGFASPGGTTIGAGYFYDTGFSGALPATAGAATGVVTVSNAPAIWLKAV